VLGVITMPLDPVLQMGPVPVHWYGVGYAVAFLVGIRMVVPFMTSRGVPEEDANNLVWWCIATGLIGARLYFVLQQPNLADYLHNPIRIIAVWEGGMAFFGTVIVGSLTVAVFAYVKRLSVYTLLDAAVLFATIPQAIGRLGNIINGDILGPPSDLPWAVRYTSPHTFAPSTEVAFQPAGAYELLISLAMFGVVWFFIRRGARPGTAALAYGVAYPLSQVGIFFLRYTEPTVAFGLKQAQLTALVFLVVAVPLVAVVRHRYPDIWASRRTRMDAEQPGAGEDEPQAAASLVGDKG
jgi:phosphatidylglycerol:prolipoprotein diacylglycerol transferase